MTTSVSAKGSENVALSDAGDENTKAAISGTVTTGDTISLTAQDAALANGAETVTHIVTSGETATTIATALASAVNADSTLQAVGISATSSGAAITLAKYTYFTTSVGSGTETLSVVSANRGSAQVTVGGTVTTGNVLSVTAHNATLPSEQETVSYTVAAGDTLLSIAQALTAAINADTTLQTAKISAGSNARLLTTQSFQQNARLNGGSNLSAASAVDGSNNTKINSYAETVNGGTSSSLTFDLNGNMTSDGTNSYSWDAENRMIKITYPGSGNYSSFVYNGLGTNAITSEYNVGTLTSTKNWVGPEERDASGAVSKMFFALGQIIGGSKYFFSKDASGSVFEFADSTSTVKSEYSYNLFGTVQKVREDVASDFTFDGYYSHSRSGLFLTDFRAYMPRLGRWLSRDPIRESGGVNLYCYVANNPVSLTDESGLGPLLQGHATKGPDDGDDDGGGDDDDPHGHCLKGSTDANGNPIPPEEGADPDPNVDLIPLMFLVPGSRLLPRGEPLPGPPFSILDWSGFPAGVPKPTGPVQLIRGNLYTQMRRLANTVNQAIRDKLPTVVKQGKQIHEIQPIKFGGSATDPRNKVLLDNATHRQANRFFNDLQRFIEQRQ